MGIGEAVAERFEDRSSTADADDLETDEIFHILQTRRRRDVLRYLRQADGPVRLGDLAERVAAWEQGTTVDALTSSERQRVYISLYQSHLPKLDREGIVDYDKDRGIVERTPLAAAFDPFIDEIDGVDRRDSWPRRYAAVAALCTLLLAALGATGVVAPAGLAAGGAVIAAFAVVIGVHARAT
ncbi:DUF7344 domain-containing protein [Salinilacihabitans rarus]|uniref:DUF7344 domain-containing protein n=1 Tax=Salinilacihabitans rarus TaxID=2961596 RepID=UPI0020C874D3|nr:hypothetical protein [Salinilacihabitans rarus]